MPQYNQLSQIQNQLGGPTVSGGSPLSTMLSTYGSTTPNTNLAPIQQSTLRTGKNPNPKFPKARHGWEEFKIGLGNLFEKGNKIAFGEPGEVQKHSTVTPEMQQVLRYLQQMGIFNFENLYDEFDPIEEQAQSGFNRDINSLAHRFTSLGSAGLDSPDFAASAGAAAGDFRTNLAAQRAQWGQQNKQNALQQLQAGLGQQVENVYRPQQNGLMQEFIKALPAVIAAAV